MNIRGCLIVYKCILNNMKNYLIIGASSGIGEKLANILSDNHNVFGTFNNHPKESSSSISYHYLDVLSDNLDLSFL